MSTRSVLLVLGLLSLLLRCRAELPPTGPFARTNLVAWCVVPFDSRKRGPEERAEMLQRLGLRRLAYDWRSEHVPTFDAEVAAMRKRGVEITAWWFPANLDAEARAILDCIRRNGIRPQLWITLGTEDEPDAARLEAKIDAAVRTLSPICREAESLGCKVALYNHLGWFGEPKNLVEVLARLRKSGHSNAGVVYNFHHAHSHIDDFEEQFRILQPHLLALNLNGMAWNGDRVGRKIIPLGTGDEELDLLRVVAASGWKGDVGIIGHTDEDAEVKLGKELDGLERLAPKFSEPRGPRKRRPTAGTAVAPGRTVRGKVETALDVRAGGRVFDVPASVRSPAFTAEAWVRVSGPEAFQILLASEAKSSTTHWELYTYAGSGDLSFYSPSMTPAEVRSGKSITDGTWHHVAVQSDRTRIRLWLDGRVVADATVGRSSEPDSQASQLALGRLVEGGLGCDGAIEQVLVRPGVREPALLGEGSVSETEAAFRWRASEVASVQPLRNPATGGFRAAAGPSRPAGEPAVSGREPGSQAEKDWVDNRWQHTDIGPFLASTLRLPDGVVVAKGLAVRTSGEGDGAIAYDLATGEVRGAWTGGFLKFDPTRFGLIGTPAPGGEVAFSAPQGKARSSNSYQYAGLHRVAGGVVLEHWVDGVRILERAALKTTPFGPVFERVLTVAPHDKPLTWIAAGHLRGTNMGTHHSLSAHAFHDTVDAKTGAVSRHESVFHRELGYNDQGPLRSGFGITGVRVLRSKAIVDDAGGRTEITLEPSGTNVTFSIFLWRGDVALWPSFEGFVKKAVPGVLPDLRAEVSTEPELTTRGVRGAETDFLTVDTLTLPYDNPQHALLFASGVDFTPDGVGYVSTIHGDVWRVTGVDAGLQDLRWRRFASGLYQPLGLKVRGGEIFVLGRDRITRLIDGNQDGVADRYESFHDGIETSTGGHDYVTCLETDSAGRFYYVDPKGLHRVSADGRVAELLASGFRNPNGMGVSPDGSIRTVSPQQGTWTPSSEIAEIREGGWYGYGGPRKEIANGLGRDWPLCWIPHGVDNSSGSQAWVPAGQWGPLGGQMLHLQWGRSGMMLVLRDTSGPVAQGAVVPLPAKFLSGPNRATFRASDGALYVAGSTGWQTSAVKDGALQRVRFTGKPVKVPVGWRQDGKALELRFAVPLERTTASDLGSYAVKRWNYRYSEEYGSKDWSVAEPSRNGRDDVAVTKASLLPDGQTIRLELADAAPAMQYELRYNVDLEGKGSASGQLWFSLHPR